MPPTDEPPKPEPSYLEGDDRPSLLRRLWRYFFPPAPPYVEVGPGPIPPGVPYRMDGPSVLVPAEYEQDVRRHRRPNGNGKTPGETTVSVRLDPSAFDSEAARLRDELAALGEQASSVASALRETSRRPNAVALAWAEILGELEAIERNGHAVVRNRDGSVAYTYDYVLESDLMANVRPKLAARGIAVFYSDEILADEPVGDPKRGWRQTRVRVTLDLVHGETGEQFTVTADDQAQDVGDKAARKAKTGAMRYLLNKGTLNPSDPWDEPDAPENEVGSDLPSAAQPEPSPEPARATPPDEPRRRPPAQQPTEERLRQQIVKLANEYDEVAEQKPTATLGQIVADMGGDLPTLANEWLVFIAKSLAAAVDAARVAKADGHAVEPFSLPSEGRPAPFS